jgi:hypothetical protein
MEDMRKDWMEDITLDVLSDTFGNGPFPTQLNKTLAPRIVQMWFTHSFENGPDEAQRNIGNYIWMNYSGGDTCHNAAKEIINGWKSANLI